ncbi:MAG: elongation factor P--(R)-beta-lysine ligase [Gammaproteobacteria bacterium]|nr:elongation factor P--(R)-beta-lysine ligase [Gammaproteobacteria bacterium]MCW5583267.1 elongation factor P--(R)-beta-lysine ligase [Gammaproteobacteria bacterium]
MQPLAASWLPSATIDMLVKRSHIIKTIRDFFHARGVMEVETPLMCHTSVTDPFIQSIPALFQPLSQTAESRYYLQTSPEYAMKRLLAAGSGAIFQISKAFRQGEIGRLHNPEFTIIEWYRPNFNHHDLMDEVDELLQLVFTTPKAERKSYRDIFMQHVSLDPHHASTQQLMRCADEKNICVAREINDRDIWLQLLMSEYIEPRIGKNQPCFIYDFPASQAALAKIQQGHPAVASRFEVYFRGIELANGFHELQDAQEQRHRFEKNLAERKQHGLHEILIDEWFLSALTHGLPDCSGVALGIDRLIMLATNSNTINEVISFDIMRA